MYVFHQLEPQIGAAADCEVLQINRAQIYPRVGPCCTGTTACQFAFAVDVGLVGINVPI